MELERIKHAESVLERLSYHLNGLLDPDVRRELIDARTILAEVRHFAVLWLDAAEVAEKQPVRGEILRDEATHRLLQVIRPD